MVPVERQEGTKLHPAAAQLLVRVAVEATRVGTRERDLEDLELEHALDAHVHVRPLAEVVAKPVSSPAACTRERAARNQEWSFARVDRLERDVCRALFHETPEVVRVELDESARVRGVCGERVVGETAGAVVDGVRRRVEVALLDAAPVPTTLAGGIPAFAMLFSRFWSSSVPTTVRQPAIDRPVAARTPDARIVARDITVRLRVASHMLR